MKRTLKSIFRYPRCPHCENILPRKSYLLRIYNTPIICPYCNGVFKTGEIRSIFSFLGMAVLIFLALSMLDCMKAFFDMSSLAGFFIYALIFLVIGIPYLLFVQPLFMTFKKI